MKNNQRQTTSSNTQRLLPTNVAANWLEARKILRDDGYSLPSNLLLERYLVCTKQYEQLSSYYCQAVWTKEIFICLPTADRFKKGKDVIASHKDANGRIWRFPASSMPSEVFERYNGREVALFFDPQNIEVKLDTVSLESAPDNIVVQPFVSDKFIWLKADERTGMPSLRHSSIPSKNRALSLFKGINIFPIARNIHENSRDRRQIDAFLPTETLYVLRVG